jgi:hypothetical protein
MSISGLLQILGFVLIMAVILAMVMTMTMIMAKYPILEELTFGLIGWTYFGHRWF